MFRDDNVCDRFKDKLDVVSVCGTCDVCVDGLLPRVLIQTDKPLSQVTDPVLVGVSACNTEGTQGMYT